MGTVEHVFEHFFTRDGFNSSLGHFQAVANIIPDIQSKENLADLLNEQLAENVVQPNQLGPIIYALLVDKYGYSYGSYNMRVTMDAFDDLHDAIKTWNSVDLVLTYIHPELGLQVINPKNKSHWVNTDALRKNELVTVYAGGMDKGVDKKVADKAVDTLISFLNGKSGKTPALLTSGAFKYSEPKKSPAPKKRKTTANSTGKSRKNTAVEDKSTETAPEKETKAGTGAGQRRMTPFYSVPVTNELFHNGNVEAWKRVIMSYQTKHPGLEVYIFYEGERIHDIHALFKWGKVKHGSTIVFTVAGDDIKDVAKLQRYLRQGASSRFEDFLRFPVNTVLNLF